MPPRLRIILILWMAGHLPFAHAESSGLATTQPDGAARIEELIHELADPDPTVRGEAQERLLAAGVAARPALLRAEKSPAPAIADRSREILQQLPWSTPADPPEVQRQLDNYGNESAAARIQVVRQLFALHDHIGFDALSRLIVEDSDRSVEWNIEQTFRQADEQLSKEQTQSLTLGADNPAALSLAGWSLEKSDFPRALELYDLAIRTAAQHDEDCVEQLAPAFETVTSLATFKKNYDQAAEIFRLKWSMSQGKTRRSGPQPNALDELMSLHARFGPLSGFLEDARENLPRLLRPHEVYCLGLYLQRTRCSPLARIVFDLAFWSSAGAPQRREGVANFLIEANLDKLAERELRGIADSWFVERLTADTALMRLGLIYDARGENEACAAALAESLPSLHENSVWISLERGGRQVYGQGAENALWTIQHHRAMLAAQKRGDNDQAVKQALALAVLLPDDADVALDAVPVLKRSGHLDEGRALFVSAYDREQRSLADSPNNPLRLNNLAWLCAMCDENLDEALKLAKRARELAPNEAFIVDTLAEVHYRRDEIDQAIETERSALVLEPGNKELKAQLERFSAARK